MADMKMMNFSGWEVLSQTMVTQTGQLQILMLL